MTAATAPIAMPASAVPDSPLPARDNLLGVCAAIGGDLGFNPDYLRVVLAASLLWNAEIVLIVYAALAALVLVSRLLFPVRRARMPVVAQPVAASTVATVEPEYALAA